MSPKCIPKELIEFSTISNGSTRSSLSQALAGEIRGEPVHAEGERKLAAVMQVML